MWSPAAESPGILLGLTPVGKQNLGGESGVWQVIVPSDDPGISQRLRTPRRK